MSPSPGGVRAAPGAPVPASAVPASMASASSPRRRRAIATVCLSGTLEDKLAAAAGAGFDAVEVFEPDLVASALSPAQVAARCADLGLGIDLYQPLRDLDSTDPATRARSARRAEAKFDVMADLGVDTALVCSSVSPDAVEDLDELAAQLAALAGRAAERGVRLAYEALAWGRRVSTWEASWEVVARADHPALGLCLDSFHVLSRGGDPAGFAAVPGEKLFFLQLADAPRLAMDVLPWSRHHRLFPGQGAFDLPGFLGHVLDAGYAGPLSLEVFNDVFRQADPHRTAVDAMRSLLALEAQLVRDPLPVPAAPALTGHAFTEVAVDALSQPQLADVLGRMGFTRTGQHRSKPVQLWEQGAARVLLNAEASPAASGSATGEAAVVALALESADPVAAAARAEALLAPVLERTRGRAEAELSAVAAPDGTQVFFARTTPDGWPADFLPVASATPTAPGNGAGAGLTSTDHVALTQPFDAYDEAALFYRSVLGLDPDDGTELAAPFGLVRSRAVSSPDRGVRIALSAARLRRGGWAPGNADPQHVAFATDDAVATAAAMRASGVPLLAVPANYHDDLDARLDLDPALLADLREHGLLYDADGRGAFLQLYTEVIGERLFFEVVQRLDGYDGYGALNAPVRMAAHQRARRERAAGS